MTEPSAAMPRRLSAWAWALALGAFVVFYRLIPYIVLDPASRFAWNLMPAAAFALFAGVRLRAGGAAVMPLVAYFVSDLLLIVPLSRLDPPMPSFTSLTPLIYLCLGATVLIGLALRRTESSPLVLGGAALLGGLIFFAVTNFACWALDDGHFYPRTLAGLGQCYVAALPFYRNTVAGDLLFTGLFFGLYALVNQARAALVRRAAA